MSRIGLLIWLGFYLLFWHLLGCFGEPCLAQSVPVPSDNSEHAGHCLHKTDTAEIKKHRRELLEDLNKKIADNPDDGYPYFQRSFIHYRLAEYKAALPDCELAIAKGVNTFRVHVLRSEILFSLQKYQEALDETNKCLAEKPDSAKCHALAAKINNQLKQYAPALQHSCKAIELAPANSQYYEIRADLDYKVEQYLRCIKDATEAINLNPKSHTAYSIRSKAYFAKGDSKQAKADEVKAKELAKETAKTVELN